MTFPSPDRVKLEEWRKVMSKSHASESFSHFIVALVGATVVVGAVAWAFVAMDTHGCTGYLKCRTATEMAQVHY
ncbi:MAG TPA: hypothetical protein VG839_07775 [Asticcacaulis sp.]|nr:hypothetical protein [Asticcacaulis sp.]